MKITSYKVMSSMFFFVALFLCSAIFLSLSPTAQATMTWRDLANTHPGTDALFNAPSFKWNYEVTGKEGTPILELTVKKGPEKIVVENVNGVIQVAYFTQNGQKIFLDPAATISTSSQDPDQQSAANLLLSIAQLIPSTAPLSIVNAANLIKQQVVAGCPCEAKYRAIANNAILAGYRVVKRVTNYFGTLSVISCTFRDPAAPVGDNYRGTLAAYDGRLNPGDQSFCSADSPKPEFQPSQQILNISLELLTKCWELLNTSDICPPSQTIVENLPGEV